MIDWDGLLELGLKVVWMVNVNGEMGIRLDEVWKVRERM